MSSISAARRLLLAGTPRVRGRPGALAGGGRSPLRTRRRCNAARGRRGVSGHEDFLQAMADPRHPEYENMA